MNNNLQAISQSRVWRIGITGGIGSGKSYICRQLEQAGHAVFYCDTEAKRIIRNHPQVRAALTELVGPGVYDAHGQLVKAQLAAYLCRGKEFSAQVDAIVHPRVAEAFNQRVVQMEQQFVNNSVSLFEQSEAVAPQDSVSGCTLPIELLYASNRSVAGSAEQGNSCPPELSVEQIASLPVGRVLFMECALLFESGFDSLVDGSVLVHVSAQTQLQRLMARDGITRQQAQAWIDLQLSEAAKLQRANFVIHNE